MNKEQQPELTAEEWKDKFKPFVYCYSGSGMLINQESPEVIERMAKECMQIAESYASLRVQQEREKQWISVEDRLPEDGEWVLAFAQTGRHIAWYSGNTFEDRAGYRIINPAHWMPLPEAPKAIELINNSND